MPTSNLSLSYHSGTSAMDWFTWLSRTTLEPSLIYHYGLIFGRNELKLEDACYFNHEFLQSIGISIAKHRLEILKLVKKDEGASAPPKKFSGVIKKCLRKSMNKFVSLENGHHVVKGVPSMVPVSVPPPEINWYQEKLKGSPVRKQKESENLKEDKPLPVPPMLQKQDHSTFRTFGL